jgi:hypothetical protein
MYKYQLYIFGECPEEKAYDRMDFSSHDRQGAFCCPFEVLGVAA